MYCGTAARMYQSASKRFGMLTMCQSRGLTSPNCNALWVSALNERRRNPDLKWFAMLHADVEPMAPWWLDTLIDEAETHKADMVSAVVPMKNPSGLTTTVLAMPDWTEKTIAANQLASRFGRLTLRQVLHSRFPTTFGINEAADALGQLPDDLRITNAPRHMLLLNTGCMVVRLTANIDWRKVYFSVIDGIVDDGTTYRYYDVSEDWLFAGRMALAGGKCMATKAVRVIHHPGDYSSDKPWGTVARETGGVDAV
jgi:hypothetical protein